MDIHDEESQDVDLIILADNGQTVEEVGEKDKNLSHLQFTDGKGRLQNSIDSPREGFIALKITYMHVFKKQQEHAKALQQKNQKLVAEIQQLKKQSDLSCSQEQVSPCDSEVKTELVGLCSDKENSDLHFQLALLEEKRSKLWSGFVHMAKYLLKREPLPSLLIEVLDNLQRLDCDSEESVKELDNLVKVMSGVDDDLSQLPMKDVAQGNVQPSDKHSNLSANKLKDPSLPKWVAGCQTQPQACKDFQSKTPQKPEANKHVKDVAVDIETLHEEDMYGVEGNGGDLDLVPYNLMRLRRKLIKLQSFPAEYGTIIQNLNDNLEQQKTTSSFKGTTFTFCENFKRRFRIRRRRWKKTLQKTVVSRTPKKKKILKKNKNRTKTRGVRAHIARPSENPNRNLRRSMKKKKNRTKSRGVPGRVPAHLTSQSKSCTELRAEPNMSGDISSFIHLHDIKVPPSDFPQTSRNSDQQQDGQNLQEGLSNTSPVKLDSPEDTCTFPYEFVRGPPNTSQFSPPVHNLSEWQSSALASVYQPPPRVTSNTVEKGNKDYHTFIPGTSETYHQIPSQLHRSNNKESIASSAPKPSSCDQDERSNKRTTVLGSSSCGLCMPGSNNDELATAHDYMSENNVTTCKMECPVCQEKFSPSATEAEVNSHVNLHFERASLDELGYDILNHC